MYDHSAYTQIIIKQFIIFSLMYIRMIGKSGKFDDKKIKRSDFTKTKKYFKLITLMLIKY